jgi:UDP-N-acetylglucosamine--N-acetylmuramyl-(pentapeptide) pyrophosphoryl-undecaprenol N-acetylglucosamine transferase
MSKQGKKIIFAAGGTGGHLFPAQALAELLQKRMPHITLLFAGAHLSGNVHFDKMKFPFTDVSSATPFGRNLFKAFRSLACLFKGVRQSFSLLASHEPDLVIGFGSFHAFPILFAARMKRIPVILFESNAIPGKVVRFFSKRALFTAVYFSGAKQHLKGKTIEVEIPIKNPESRKKIDAKQARTELGLDPHLSTILVFGGSQGAKKINQEILELLPLLKKGNTDFQLIHLTGSEEMAAQVTHCCAALNIPSYVKKFETRMNLAWSAADLAICRSGAMTVSELLHYEVPSILVPYPSAADQHQHLNALFIEQKVGGGIVYLEHAVSGASFVEAVQRLICLDSPEKIKMKKAITAFKMEKNKHDLTALVIEVLHG